MSTQDWEWRQLAVYLARRAIEQMPDETTMPGLAVDALLAAAVIAANGQLSMKDLHDLLDEAHDRVMP